jgi:hypothetical protein
MDSFFENFEPLKFTPQQEAVLEIQDHMRQVMNDLALVYAQSCHGYALLSEHLEQERASLLEQLTEMVGTEEAHRIYQKVSQLLVENRVPAEIQAPSAVGTLKHLHSRAGAKGENAAALGAFCLIALYQYWEDSWRPHLADALAKPKNEIASDLWGDIRLIRICLIHKRGVANSAVADEAKELRWFSEGQTIVIDPPKFGELMTRVRDFMERLPTQYGPALDSTSSPRR